MAGLIKRFPWLIASVQTGGLMAAGDVLCQTYVDEKNIREIDVHRTMKFGALGFFMVGPTLHWWYGVLERRVVFKAQSLTALGKVAADQLIFAPCFMGAFLVTNGAMNFKPKAQIQHELKRDYLHLLLTSYKIWPAVQILNFYVVPFQFRILLVQTVALFWNTYLSWTVNQSK